jgi:hypothetical protein
VDTPPALSHTSRTGGRGLVIGAGTYERGW